MPPRRGKIPGSEEAKPRPAAPVVASEKSPKAAEGGSAWGRPREPPPARAQAPAAPAAPAPAKAKAAARTPTNIAAQAARNLGGFVPNKIFVGGVPITCTEEQFKLYFEPFGHISKVELHALRGFGYITYETVEAVDACLEKYEDHYLCKKWVEVKRSIPRELIDAYEREQRRLHAECPGEGGDRSSVAVECAPVKAEPSPAPSMATAGPARSRGATQSWREPAGAASLSRIAQLREMGFSDEVARRVLAECAWDVNEAIDRLLLSGAMATDADSASGGPPPGGGDEPAAAEEPGPAAAAAPPEPARGPEPPPAAPPAPEAAGTGAAVGPTEEASPSPSPTPSPAEAVEDGARAAGAAPGAAASGASGASGAGAVELTDEATAGTTAAGAPPQATADPALEAGDENTPVAGLSSASAVQDADVATVAGEPAVAAEAPPRKRLERVLRTWMAEDASQMGVAEGDFVQVWIDTGTENGWIHAEALDAPARVGWLPLCALKRLPEGQQWMRVGQQWEAMDESQCSVQTGAMVVVWSATRTKEGWVHVEAEKEGALKPGWLPVFCLEWGGE